MHTTQQQILERLRLLPETMLREVLLFVDFLHSRPKSPIDTNPNAQSSFVCGLKHFRAQIEAEGSDIEERDFFADVRDRTLTSEQARW